MGYEIMQETRPDPTTCYYLLLVHDGIPQEVFLALSFDNKIPQGTVLFHKGFLAND